MSCAGDDSGAAAATTIPVFVNPATQETVTDSEPDFNTVAAVSVSAFQDWKTGCRSYNGNASCLNTNTDELAGLITLENEKTLQDAAGDVFRGLEVV